MDFQNYQRAFTGRIRNRQARLPANVPAADMRIYQQLVFDNIETFLLACFPVCRKLLGQRRWIKLIRHFFRDHASQTPFFRQISEEFLAYLQDELPDDPELASQLPAFLPELAHYEWVELALDTSNQDRDLPPHDPGGDLLTGRPLINPVMQVLAYQWPVHRLSPRYRPPTPPAEITYLIAYRDRRLKVRFMAVNALSARLLSVLREQPDQTGATILRMLAEQVGGDGRAVQEHGAKLLGDLLAQDVLLGSRV